MKEFVEQAKLLQQDAKTGYKGAIRRSRAAGYLGDAIKSVIDALRENGKTNFELWHELWLIGVTNDIPDMPSFLVSRPSEDEFGEVSSILSSIRTPKSIPVISVYLAWVLWRDSETVKRKFYDLISIEGVRFFEYDDSHHGPEFDDPIQARKNWDEHNSLSIPQWTTERPTQGSNFAQWLERDYEVHDLEKEFSDYILESSSGYWELVGQQGQGKTALMAAMYRNLANHQSGYIHFFQKSPSHPDENDLDRAVGFLCEQIIKAYDLHPPHRLNLSAKEMLHHLMRQLGDSSNIAAHRPVVIFFDALDEADAIDALGKKGALPKWVPSELPEGVFVAFSRQPTAEEHMFEVKANVQKRRYIRLDSHAHFEKVKDTAFRYAKTKISEHGELGQYESADAAAEYWCKLTNWNFLVLRLVLSDAEGWAEFNRADDTKLTSDDVYRMIVDRALADGKDDDQYPERRIFESALLYLCGLAESVPRDVLYAIALPDDFRTRSIAERTLDIWNNKGLLLSKREGLDEWVYPPHHSFRDYLKTKLDEQDFSRVISPMVKNLRTHVLLPEFPVMLRDMVGARRRVWIDLCVQLGLAGRAFGMLQVLLCNEHFWVACNKIPGGLKKLMERMTVEHQDADFNEAMNALLNETTDFIVKLVKRWDRDSNVRPRITICHEWYV